MFLVISVVLGVVVVVVVVVVATGGGGGGGYGKGYDYNQVRWLRVRCQFSGVALELRR